MYILNVFSESVQAEYVSPKADKRSFCHHPLPFLNIPIENQDYCRSRPVTILSCHNRKRTLWVQAPGLYFQELTTLLFSVWKWFEFLLQPTQKYLIYFVDTCNLPCAPPKPFSDTPAHKRRPCHTCTIQRWFVNHMSTLHQPYINHMSTCIIQWHVNYWQAYKIQQYTMGLGGQ